jgi:enoyl-CoA hydratase
MNLTSTQVGRTLVLTIDRPPVNALDLAAAEALRDGFAAIGRDPPRDGVVLTGAGDRAFCAGVDTRAFADLDPFLAAFA